jgi:hypothetical protein
MKVTYVLAGMVAGSLLAALPSHARTIRPKP